MKTIMLKGPHGREYKVTTWPIEAEAKLSDWRSKHCVLIVTKEEADKEPELISIWDIRGDQFEVKRHFTYWHSIDTDGRPSHIDRQLGATHYGVIPCHEDENVDDLARELTKANRPLFDRMPRVVTE